MSAERGIAEALFLKQNAEFVDWWLLQKFPGRTLEELDSIDWLRLQRAMEVDDVVRVEERNRQYHAKELKKLTPREVARVHRHNLLLAEYFGDDDDDEEEFEG